jgi:hypothetical protein
LENSYFTIYSVFESFVDFLVFFAKCLNYICFSVFTVLSLFIVFSAFKVNVFSAFKVKLIFVQESYNFYLCDSKELKLEAFSWHGEKGGELFVIFWAIYYDFTWLFVSTGSAGK